ncbi:MAG: tRNA 2-thiocytidine biosynthesis protein TtcA [Clostridia bacterium]|nr:tRNA 2-thiocytidine biosynthesis protein TtcA [Clostridia bacterium]
MAKRLERWQEIERSIITTYRKTIWSPFVLAVKKYGLVQAGDKIAVCISGGKDSMLLAKLMQELQRHSEVPFELVFLVMDPGYNQENRARIEENAALLRVPIEVFESDIFAAADNAKALGEGSPCYLCARMRRGHLYAKAKELGCNKIALGHHKSDVIETTVMGMLYGGQIQGMLPRLKSTNFEGMELIRPLYCVLEEDIVRWKNHNGLEFIACACRFTEESTREVAPVFSARKRVKELIAELKRENPNVESCIFQSIHNVQLDTLVGYKKEGVEHFYLERLDAKESEEQTE